MEFCGFDATNRTCQEVECLPHAGFFLLRFIHPKIVVREKCVVAIRYNAYFFPRTRLENAKVNFKDQEINVGSFSGQGFPS